MRPVRGCNCIIFSTGDHQGGQKILVSKDEFIARQV